jgi:hypothetical protein
MKPAHCLTVAFLLLSAGQQAIAQLDSLYTQQWNRDPITNLNSTTSAQRQIITAEQIRVSGYTKLSDLIQLFDGWTFATRDGNNWTLQSNGTGAYDFQNWVLMVNGQRVELNRAHTLDLNLLGISVADIERIEVVNSNGMYLGEFTQNGLINIITKKSSKDGFSYRGNIAYNLNTIDPDRTSYPKQSTYPGLNTSQTLGFTKNKFHLNVSFGYLATNAPDTILRYPLSRPIPGNETSGDTYTSRLESQYAGKKFSHQISAALVKKTGTYPTLENKQAGYLGLYNINNQHQIRLSSTYSNIQDPIIRADLSTTTLQYRYLKPKKNGTLIWQTGIASDYFKYNVSKSLTNLDYFLGQGFHITDTNVVIIKPYSSINIPITRKTILFADAQVALAHGKAAPRISVGLYKRVSLISNYSFVVGYTERLLEEDFMTNIGQRVNAIEGATYFYNPKLATADFYYNLNIGENVKFSFNSGLKNTYALPGVRYFLVPSNNNGSQQTYYYLDEWIKRSTYDLNWINRVNIHYDIVKNLVFDINYMHTRSLNTWNENIQNIPKYKFTFILQYNFPKLFTLWSRNYWQSKTTFWNYQPHQNSQSLYTNLPQFLTWDIGISKKLFKEYLLFNLSARNIFNTREQYYPTGSQLDIRFSASIAANIEGLFAKGNPKP